MRRAIALSIVSLAIVAFAGSTVTVGRTTRAVALAGVTGSDGMCRYLPAGDVTRIARERMDKVTDVADFCSYGGRTPGGGTPATVTLVLNPGTPEQARELEPDATEITVSGVPALIESAQPVPTGMREADIHLFPDEQSWYQISVIFKKRVPMDKALRQLGEVFLARLGTTAAPSPSPVPTHTITSLCLILTADEVSAAYGGAPIGVVADHPTNCVYSAEASGDAATGLVTNLAPPAPEGVSYIDLARAEYPDAVEVEVAGVPALFVAAAVADLTGTQPSGTLHVFPDATTWLLLEGSAPATVDLQAALTSLAELAVPRLLVLLAAPPPSPSPSPSASAVAAGDLAALFPTEVAGSPFQIQKTSLGSAYGGFLTGEGAKAYERITRLLKDRGLKPTDAALWLGASASGGAIFAVHVRGSDIAPFVTPLLTVLSMSPSDGEVPEALAAKGVTAINAQGQPGFAYPKDDVLWIVVPPSGDDGTALFDALP